MAATHRRRTARLLTAAVVAAALTAVVPAPPAGAQAMGFDPTFSGGKVVIDTGAKEQAQAVALQADGALVVVGNVSNADGTSSMLVTRLGPDGRPDASFGAGGRTLLGGLWLTRPDGLAVQPDGKILLATSQRTLRLAADGREDPAWGAGIAVPGGSSLALQADGRVLVASDRNDGQEVARMNPDGSPDPTFGTAGTVVTSLVAGNPATSVRAMGVEADGRIVLAGVVHSLTTASPERFALLRLTPGGQPDPSFGSGGRVTTGDNVGTTDRSWVIESMAIQPGGGIVVAGYVYTSGSFGRTDLAVARYREDGTLDPAFGAGAVVIVQGPPAVDSHGGQFTGGSVATAVAVDPSGRPVVVGGMMGVGSGDVAVARFTPGGALDTSFNGNGWVRIDLSGNSDTAQALALQPDGRIVVAGTRDTGAGDVAVLRLVDADPAGQLEGMDVSADAVASVRGWVADADATAPLQARITVDGSVRTTVTADQSRPDVGRADARGFGAAVAVGPGNHSVCAYAVNQGAGADARLGCAGVIASRDPFGSLDVVGRRPGGVLVSGWGIDPDASGPVTLYVYADGTFRQAVAADQLRADVAAAFPGFGDHHGFQTMLALAPGLHNVCVFGVNQGPGTHQLLGCRNVWVAVDPIGSLDVAMTMGGPVGVGVRGWSIDPDVAAPVTVYIYVDGTFLGALAANQTRTDVNAAVPGYGPAHGFEAFLPGPPPGLHTICAFGINQGTGANSLLGCRRG